MAGFVALPRCEIEMNKNDLRNVCPTKLRRRTPIQGKDILNSCWSPLSCLCSSKTEHTKQLECLLFLTVFWLFFLLTEVHQEASSSSQVIPKPISLSGWYSGLIIMSILHTARNAKRPQFFFYPSSTLQFVDIP